MILPQRYRHAIKLQRAPDRTLGNCWIWQGSTNNHGYGQSHRKCDTNSRLVHRQVYELFCGTIPAGNQIDHLCRVRACCNPRHLEAVTAQENSLRSERATRTHCIRGHELSGENLVVKKPGDRGRRQCRTCLRAAWAARDKRRAAARREQRTAA